MNIAQYIDHTNLKPFATSDAILQLCYEAKIHNFRAVCVNPCWVAIATERLANSDVKIAAVIGFPLGANRSEFKMAEAKDAVNRGATEIDMVWNLGKFKTGNYLKVMHEIEKVVDIVHPNIVKVIVETCYLNIGEIRKAHQIVKDSGAQYIKTSTGFGSDGAKPSTIETWKKLGNLKIKASGGIKDYQQAKKFVAVGAHVIGTSSGVKIVEEENVFLSSSPFPNESFPVT